MKKGNYFAMQKLKDIIKTYSIVINKVLKYFFSLLICIIIIIPSLFYVENHAQAEICLEKLKIFS